MPDNKALFAAIDEALANRIGAVTDATTALSLGHWAQAAHYCADAACWDARVKALSEAPSLMEGR